MKGQRGVGQSQSPGLPHLSGLPSSLHEYERPSVHVSHMALGPSISDQIKSPMHEIWAHRDIPPLCGAGMQFLEEPVVLSGKSRSLLPKYRGTLHFRIKLLGFPGGSDDKDGSDACQARDPGWSLGQEDSLEKEVAPYSSILAWRIPWTEEHGRLQSIGLQRVRHDWATNIFKWKLAKSPPGALAPLPPQASADMEQPLWGGLLFKFLFIWLCWIFFAVHRLSLVATSGG